jgi:hypothetical protein
VSFNSSQYRNPVIPAQRQQAAFINLFALPTLRLELDHLQRAGLPDFVLRLAEQLHYFGRQDVLQVAIGELVSGQEWIGTLAAFAIQDVSLAIDAQKQIRKGLEERTQFRGGLVGLIFALLALGNINRSQPQTHDDAMLILELVFVDFHRHLAAVRTQVLVLVGQ